MWRIPVPEIVHSIAAAGELGAGDVHLWLVDVSGQSPPLHTTADFLSAFELARAETLPTGKRDRYLRIRTVLRLLLAHYLRIPPRSIVIRNEPNGKPTLATRHHMDIRFNLSHTGGVVLLGFSRAGDIGVDAERRNRPADFPKIARRIFSDNEYACFEQLPDAQQRSFFYMVWTRKEALLKGIGRGLRVPMNAFEVTGPTPSPARFQSGMLRIPVHDEWYVGDAAFDSDYCCAYALPGLPADPRLFQRSEGELCSEWRHTHG